MLLAAETADPGWAHLVGLMIAATIAFLGVWTHRWWMDYRGLSPTPPGGDDTDVTPGETVVSDDDDTDPDTFDDTLPDGRYRMMDGSILVRAWRPPHTGDIDLDLDEPDGLEDEETREEMADRLVGGGGSYADWVREIMNAHDVSEATAKRAIRDARDRLDA
jgi:hypothetical protein